MVWFLWMSGLDGLLPTSGDNFITIAPFETYLLRKLLLFAIIFCYEFWKIIWSHEPWNFHPIFQSNMKIRQYLLVLLQERCMISWGSITAQSARTALVDALTSTSIPSSTSRSTPPWRLMTPTWVQPDNTHPLTAIKVRWLMSHRDLPLKNEH